MAKFFLLLIGLFVGVGGAVAYSSMKPPPGQRRPRPNRRRRDKLIHSILPIAAAIGLSVVAWVGLSLLFSSDKTAQGITATTKQINQPVPEVVHHSVTKKIDTAGIGAQGIQVKEPHPIENPLAMVQHPQAPVEPISKIGPSSSLSPDREPIPALAKKPSSPPTKPAISEAAQRVSPKEPTQGHRQLGQGLVKAEAEPEIETPLISDHVFQPDEPKTLAHPRVDAPLTHIFPELKHQEPAMEARLDLQNQGRPAYTVLLASFTMKNNAERNLARLRSAGVPAFISLAQINHRQYFRLMAGRFPSKAEASRYGRKMERNGLTRETGKYMIKSLD